MTVVARRCIGLEDLPGIDSRIVEGLGEIPNMLKTMAMVSVRELAAGGIGDEGAAVVTNQVISKPGEYNSGAVYPAGGHIVGHASHTRVLLRRKGGGEVRIARLVASPYLPEGEALFRVTANDIVDIEGECGRS